MEEDRQHIWKNMLPIRSCYGALDEYFGDQCGGELPSDFDRLEPL